MTEDKKTITGSTTIIKATPGYELLSEKFEEGGSGFVGFDSEPIIAWQIEPSFEVDERHGRPRYDDSYMGDFQDPEPESTSTIVRPITVSGWYQEYNSGPEAKKLGWRCLIKAPDGRILNPDEQTIVCKDEEECLKWLNEAYQAALARAAAEEAARIAAGQKHTREQVHDALLRAKVSYNDAWLKEQGIKYYGIKHADYDRVYAYCLEKFKAAKDAALKK